MKTRTASKLPLVKIGSSSVMGRELVSWSDNVHFSSYDVTLQPGTTITLTSCFGEDHNHVYYCCYGEAVADIPNSTVTLTKGTVVGLGGKMSMKVKATGVTCLMVTYIKEEAPPCEPLVRKMEEVSGSVRDVDWQHGRSRRFLLQCDGFNMTLTSTLCYPHHVSPMTYPNNLELCYYLRGDVTYTWDDGKQSCIFQQEKIEDGNGGVFLMDKNDPHEVHTRDKECETLCVFYPALKGTESHDFISDVASSF